MPGQGDRFNVVVVRKLLSEGNANRAARNEQVFVKNFCLSHVRVTPTETKWICSRLMLLNNESARRARSIRYDVPKTSNK